MTPLLDVEGMHLYYSTSAGPVRAVDDVSFTIEQPGEALAIVGESGSGKTSLALALMRLLPRNTSLYEGRVHLNGTDLMALNDEEFRKQVRWKQISLVFQGAMNVLNPVLRVGPQVAEPLQIARAASKGEAYRKAAQFLEMVGLAPDVFDRYPHELSGGMKQRVLIAMALVLEPRLIILDEPTSALDVSVQAQITNLLKRLKWTQGLSMMFITHDIALASDLCDRIAVAYAGELVEIGTAEQVLTQPAHPYTRKLLASVPRLHAPAPPEFIPGAPPDLRDPPSGCRFHPRCSYAFSRCSQETPPPLQVGNKWVARCWLFAENAPPTPPAPPTS